jgi:outer membrane lipoprotein LolB
VPGLEEIKLSGPLGQRAAVIRLTGAFVSIDHGDGKLESSEEPEEFVNQQLGVYVPLVSLRYWAFGLPESTHAYMETIDGFSQAGWLISYKQMQIVSGQSLPRKIVASNSDVKLKLVIDQWIISDTKAK